MAGDEKAMPKRALGNDEVRSESFSDARPTAYRWAVGVGVFVVYFFLLLIALQTATDNAYIMVRPALGLTPPLVLFFGWPALIGCLAGDPPLFREPLGWIGASHPGEEVHEDQAPAHAGRRLIQRLIRGAVLRACPACSKGRAGEA